MKIDNKFNIQTIAQWNGIPVFWDNLSNMYCTLEYINNHYQVTYFTKQQIETITIKCENNANLSSK